MTQNPARALYNQWFKILQAYKGIETHEHMGRLKGSAWLSYPVGVGVITNGAGKGGSDDRPNLGLGMKGRWDWHPFFALTADGRFELTHFPRAGWGNNSLRNTVENHTFLRTIHDFRTYNWTADRLDDRSSSRGSWCREWENPLPHVGEWALDLSWGLSGNWLQLKGVQNDALGRKEWHIVPAKRDTWPQVDDRIEAFAKFDTMRRRRIAAHELKVRRQRGEVPWPTRSHSVPSEQREERVEQRQTEAATMLLAHFDVSTPARTTPLRRNREEGLWAEPLGSR